VSQADRDAGGAKCQAAIARMAPVAPLSTHTFSRSHWICSRFLFFFVCEPVHTHSKAKGLTSGIHEAARVGNGNEEKGHARTH
jgi:hypothetical protein